MRTILLAFSLVCFIIDFVHPMENNSVLVQNHTSSFAEFFYSLKNFFVLSSENYMLQSTISSFKTLYKICYSYPKLCLGGTSLTAALYLLITSDYLPITKHELFSLKRASLSHLLHHTQEFTQTTNAALKKQSVHLDDALQASQELITTINNELSDIQHSVVGLPEYVQEVLHYSSTTSKKKQSNFLKYSQHAHEQTIQSAQISLLDSFHQNEKMVNEKLQRLMRFKYKIEQEMQKTAQDLTHDLQSELDAFTSLQNSLQEDEILQLETFAQVLATNDNSVQSLVQSLFQEFSHLEHTITQNSLCNEFAQSLHHQEKLLDEHQRQA